MTHYEKDKAQYRVRQAENYYAAVMCLVKETGWTQDQFGAKTGKYKKYIERISDGYRNGTETEEPAGELRFIMNMAVVLELDKETVYFLMSMGGVCFSPSNEFHRVCKIITEDHLKDGIDKCNELLMEHGIPVFTTDPG